MRLARRSRHGLTAKTSKAGRTRLGAFRIRSAQLLPSRLLGRRALSDLEGGDDLGYGKVVVLGLKRDFTLAIGLGPEGSLVDRSLVVYHWSVSGSVCGGGVPRAGSAR